jgi:hypothetical protein
MLTRICFFLLLAGSVSTFGSESRTKYRQQRSKVKVVNILKDESVSLDSFAIQGTFNHCSKEKPLSISSTRTAVTYFSTGGSFECRYSVLDTVITFGRQGYRNAFLIRQFQGGSRVTVKLNFKKKLRRGRKHVAYKPVIYCYNSPDPFRIRVSPKGRATFVYPGTEPVWELTADENGLLTDNKSGATYPYLFWESDHNSFQFTVDQNGMQGYLIRTDTVVDFLAHVLAEVGLNNRESADFITFWAPKMIKEKYALVQFLSTEDYEKHIAGISVAPDPDAMLRLYMYFMPLDNSNLLFEVRPQQFESFRRSGFTVIEWGGSAISGIPLVFP